MPACALLVAAAAVASSLAATPAASADASEITIISVSSPTPPAGNAGLMTVTTQSPTPITDLAVHLYDGQGHLQLTIPFSYFSGAPGTQPTEELWSMSTPITTTGADGLPGLPPGTYTATVDATDSDGPETGLAGGTFPFLIQPFVTLSAAPSSISYTQQTVKFSGRATDVIPGTMATVPFANEQVQIVGPTTPADPIGLYTATTDKNGNFQISVQPQPDNYYSSIPATSGMAGAQSSLVQITDSPTPLRLAAKFTSDAIEYGHGDEMTGSLKYYQSAKTLKPLPDTTVTITRLAPPGEPKITAKTNSAGQFSARIPRQTATGTWAVTAGGTALLGKALVTRTLAVHQTTGFKRTSMALSTYGVLTVKTCLVDTSPGRSGTVVNSPVQLQYGRGARGRWKQLVTIQPTSGVAYCPGRSPLWTISVNAPEQNAYYRLRFAGTPTMRVSVSKVRHLWRDATRITSFKISPRHVHAKGAVTVSGRLWRSNTTPGSGSPANGPWIPYAGRKVAVLFVYKGQAFVFDSEPKTNSQGDFSGLFTAYVTAKWLAQYNGDKMHFASTSPQIKIKVSGSSGKLLQLDHLMRAGYRVGQPGRPVF